MPHFVFVWTAGDIVGLIVLALILLGTACFFVAVLIDNIKRRINRWRTRRAINARSGGQ
jgi:hypothetical protein